MSSYSNPRGFLPPTTTAFTDEPHPRPPSPTATPSRNNPHHLPGFTALPLPQISPATPTTTSSLLYSSPESQVATAIGLAIYNIRDAVFAASAVDNQNPIRRTKSDINPRPTTAARRNPLRRTISDTTTPPPPPSPGTRTVCPSPNSRNVVSESLNREESPQIKRLMKLKEMVTDMEQRCWEFKREFESESELRQENVEDDEPSEVSTDQDEAREERSGFKQLNEGQEERVRFEQLENGDIRIHMRCSCYKRYETLHNQIGLFYRLI